MRAIKIAIIVFCLLIPMQAKASDIEKELNNTYDFTEIDSMLDEIFPDEKLNFKDTVLSLITGDVDFSFGLMKEMFLDQLFYEIESNKSGMIHMLLLVIIAAIFTNFSAVFKSTQVAEISFSMLYMLLLTICLNNFRILIVESTQNMDQLMTFMKLLNPVYFMAVAVSTGSSTSVAFYQIILLLILLVEMLICNFLIPVTQIYMLIKILDEFSPEIHLSKFSELIETIVSWSLKTLTAGIIGLNVIQGLLTPAIDSVKRSLVTKGGEAIPIVGDAIGGTTEVFLGSAVLIKNGIGVAGMIICLVVCFVPIIQIAITSLLYQVVAALIQPISDQRMVNCVSGMASGTKMLLRIVTTTGILFLLTIAVVANTTGG